MHTHSPRLCRPGHGSLPWSVVITIVIHSVYSESLLKEYLPARVLVFFKYYLMKACVARGTKT